MTIPPQISTRSNWFRYAPAFIPAGIIYVFRSWFIFWDLGLLCLISIVSLVVILAAFIYAVSTKNLAIIGTCTLFVAISMLAPRIEPEQVHLHLFRSEYQAVVNLARNHQLVHEGDCQFAYALPDEYSNLARRKSKCVFVEYEPALVVVFEPLYSRKLLVYAETPEAARNYISCGGSDAIGSYQLEENWYKCFQDPN